MSDCLRLIGRTNTDLLSHWRNTQATLEAADWMGKQLLAGGVAEFLLLGSRNTDWGVEDVYSVIHTLSRYRR